MRDLFDEKPEPKPYAPGERFGDRVKALGDRLDRERDAKSWLARLRAEGRVVEIVNDFQIRVTPAPDADAADVLRGLKPELLLLLRAEAKT